MNNTRIEKRTAKRLAAEKRFKWMCRVAVSLAAIFLVTLLVNIARSGAGGFLQTSIVIDLEINPQIVGNIDLSDPVHRREQTNQINSAALLSLSLKNMFPKVTDIRERRRLLRLLSVGARAEVRNFIYENPTIVGTTQSINLLASDDIDQLVKGNINRNVPESDRRIKDLEIAWLDKLTADGRVKLGFHQPFVTSGDSREPELAGVWGAVVGSTLTLFVTILFAFPVGLLASIYLEEFAPKNRITDFIDANINNLAAVPSIVFGLLGLAFFLGVLGLPRSAPLVGGLTLALMSLPTIIITSRTAIKAVPNSVKEAAIGIGASPMQVVFHHVIPNALPGIMTGAIIGVTRALGETAPLLMIGMVAFVVDIPNNVTDAATALPVQIFLWADNPERAFIEKTSAAIMVLLILLIGLNALAVWLRNRFENRATIVNGTEKMQVVR